MAKYELTVSENYVRDWGFVDGVREIFQNALDQETECVDNKMFFEYDKEKKVLRIGNKKSSLDASTLLLGSTTKEGNKNLIGHFGEGYKIATLVLIREGHNVVFYNYGVGEVWRPRFVNSRRFKSRILTFFVDKKYVWEKVPNHDLIIEIDNVTEEKYNEVVKSNLHLQDKGKVIETEKGEILLNTDFKGKIYVNGLYVCTYDEYYYGYNFKPSEINLDRDRKLVNDFDLRWLTSTMWVSSSKDKEAIEIVKKLIQNDAPDVDFIRYVETKKENYIEIAKLVAEDFKLKYGYNAVPVNSQSEYDIVKDGYKPIIVSEKIKELLIDSGYNEYDVYEYKMSVRERLLEWLEINKENLTEESINEFYGIVENLDY